MTTAPIIYLPMPLIGPLIFWLTRCRSLSMRGLRPVVGKPFTLARLKNLSIAPANGFQCGEPSCSSRTVEEDVLPHSPAGLNRALSNRHILQKSPKDRTAHHQRLACIATKNGLHLFRALLSGSVRPPSVVWGFFGGLTCFILANILAPWPLTPGLPASESARS